MPAIMAKALAISGTVTRDSFASCKSLARLNWTIDTKLNPTTLTPTRIRVVSTTVKKEQARASLSDTKFAARR
jgi:hypothetical protein